MAPRLFFEDATLCDTALKLKRLLGTDNRPYLDALGVVLAHELVRPNVECERVEAPARGGLAPWQQRMVTSYIEEHLAEQISLATLAQLVRLSPYYFCRAFKQSLGEPPHRYHNNRRIEHAKTLLANRCRLGDGDRVGARLQRDQLVHGGFSQDYGDDPDRYAAVSVEPGHIIENEGCRGAD